MKLLRTFNLLATCLLFLQPLASKTVAEYAASAIPKELLTNADAVVREKSTRVEVVDVDKVVMTEKYVLTILKESGKPKSYFTEYYSKFVSLSDIEANVYDKDGKKLRRIKMEDIEDYSAISGISLYDDQRVKYIDPMENTYPFTVEFTFERKLKTAYYLNNWYAFEGYNTSVQFASCELIAPADYEVRWQERNLEKAKITTSDDGKKIYTWQLRNYEAPTHEPLSAPLENWGPMVVIAPTRFEIDGYEGTLDSWSSLGKFCYELNKDRGIVPPETLEKVKSLLNDDMSEYEKIQTIYHYAQQKNRYINIAIGIGGLQPFPAETVDRLSYGDCKALSNYTASLLRACGFTAHYTLAGAGEHDFLDPGFVKDYFNHIIVAVPLQKDTVWLECTSAFSPAGYLSDFTDDRYVLLIKEDGGQLVKTPGYAIDENNKAINGSVQLKADGSAILNYTRTYSGATYDQVYRLTLMDEKDRRKSIIKSIQIPHFDLMDYQLEVHKQREPSVDKKIKVNIPACYIIVGEKYFLKLNQANELSGLPPYSRNRTTPLYWERNYSEDDTLTFDLPEDFDVETLPDAKQLDTEFGTYYFTVEKSNQKIIYRRHLEIYKGTYPKDKYNAFIDFLSKVVQADKSQAIITRKG